MIIYKKEHVVFSCDENEEWQAEDGAQSVHPLTAEICLLDVTLNKPSSISLGVLEGLMLSFSVLHCVKCQYG